MVCGFGKLSHPCNLAGAYKEKKQSPEASLYGEGFLSVHGRASELKVKACVRDMLLVELVLVLLEADAAPEPDLLLVHLHGSCSAPAAAATSMCHMQNAAIRMRIHMHSY